MSDTYRLITRSDFDGLICAVLLKDLDLIDDIKFVHPKDMQDGLIEVGPRDILTNLPYVEGAHLVFDHHSSEVQRNKAEHTNHIIDPDAPSAARVVFKHFGGCERYGHSFNEMMEAVDRADSADYEMRDVLHPKAWTLLNFIMDARTGLGRFHDFKISNYDLMMNLIEECRTKCIEKILELPDVKERIDVYLAHAEQFKEQVLRCSMVHGNVVALDLREEETIYAGNRFMIYALHPQATVSVHALWGRDKLTTVLALGKSIFDRSCRADLGKIALRHGGGGHQAAATCQVPHGDAERVLFEIVDAIECADQVKV